MKSLDILQLKTSINELTDNEVKSLLLQILIRADMLKETEDYSDTNFINDIYEYLANVERKSSVIEEEQVAKIHIVFSESTKGTLKQALKKMHVDDKEKIISLSDMFSVGPVWHLDEEIGREKRFQWMASVKHEKWNDYEDYRNQMKESLTKIASIPEDIPIVIWVAENAHEQTGLRYALHLLSNRKYKIHVMNITKMHDELFKKRHSDYRVLHSGELSDEQLQVIYKSTNLSVISVTELECLVGEWRQLVESRKCLRIWKDHGIQSVEEEDHDREIIKYAKNLQRENGKENYMPSARLVGEVIGHLDQYVGDEFIEYRVKKLIEQGVFEVQGSLASMRFYLLRMKQ